MLSVAFFVMALQEPAPTLDPRFLPGKDTTVVMGPVRADGFVDYLAELNKIRSAGVVADENGAREFLSVFPEYWTGKVGEHRSRELGGRAKVIAFVSLDDWAKTQQPPIKPSELEVAIRNATIEQDKTLPARASHAVLLAWLDSQKPALDQIVAATTRPRWFIPLVYDDAKSLTLLELPLDHLAKFREIAYALSIRAVFRAEAGEMAAALDDSIAVARLAAVLSKEGSCMLEVLLAFVLNQTEHLVEVHLASKNKSVETATKRIAEYRSIREFSEIADVMDKSERFFLLDATARVTIQGPSSLPGLRLNADIIGSKFDANEAMRVVNREVDRVAEIMRIPYSQTRYDRIDEFNKRLAAVAKAHTKVNQAIADPSDAGRHVGEAIWTKLMPNFASAEISRRKSMARRRLTLIAWAASAYRAEKGRTPVSLQQLRKYLQEEEITCPLTTEPFKLRIDGKMMVYSISNNFVDDRGENETSSAKGYDPKTPDDITIRF